MNLFEYDDHRKYLSDKIMNSENNGRGQISKLAKYLSIHSSLMSNILNHKRDMTEEQSFKITQYFELTDLETDFFILLNKFERAGEFQLKNYYKVKIEKIRTDSKNLSAHVQHSKKLSDNDMAIFYSSWLYSAIRLFCSLNDAGKTTEEISDRFSINRESCVQKINFLLKTGLIKESKNRYMIGEQKTYVDQNSPHLIRHQQNWRFQSMLRADNITAEELMVTSPFSVSKKDFAKIKMQFIDFIQKSSKTIKDSKAEDMACFNFDLFWIK